MYMYVCGVHCQFEQQACVWTVVHVPVGVHSCVIQENHRVYYALRSGWRSYLIFEVLVKDLAAPVLCRCGSWLRVSTCTI